MRAFAVGQRREMAETAVARRRASIALACRTFGVSETCYRYSPKLQDENEEIADLLVGLTESRKTWGFGLCFLHLRNVQGRLWILIPGNGLPKDSATTRPFIASDQRRLPDGPAKTSIRLTDSKWCSRCTPNHASHEKRHRQPNRRSNGQAEGGGGALLTVVQPAHAFLLLDRHSRRIDLAR